MVFEMKAEEGFVLMENVYERDGVRLVLDRRPDLNTITGVLLNKEQALALSAALAHVGGEK